MREKSQSKMLMTHKPITVKDNKK